MDDMDDQEYQKLEDLLIKAVQSGKKETSDLVDHILHKMEPAIATGIEKNVNGNMRDMKQHLKDQDKKLEDIHVEQTRVREELKKVQPLITTQMTVFNVGRFVIWLGAISGATAGIFWLIDKLKDIK